MRVLAALTLREVWLLIGGLFLLPIVFVALRRLVALAFTIPAAARVPAFSRRLSPWISSHHHTGDAFFTADGAPRLFASRRRAGLDELGRVLQHQYAAAGEWAGSLRNSFSDLRFTDASRVPFPFIREMRKRFDLYSVVTGSEGPRLQHIDGHTTLDVSGSYGLNVAGFDRYKEWMQRGWDRVKDLGPVLGPLHPVVAENVASLKRLSGLDEVSFHMSGTEAVMAAVRLARFNTRRRLIVCFSGAYHGWWDGVQTGLGSERSLDDCLTLQDLSPASLRAIRHRRREIAAVLVNPVQAFHPNSPPPNDAVLLTSDVRTASASTDRYGAWLRELRAVCRESNVPLILDEVYTGFRLAPRGAQEFFGLDADMVVYGKSVAGGMPIGVVCGRSALMRRLDPDHPMRMAYVVGTFSAHPLVMGAMREFLDWIAEAAAPARFSAANQRCADWVRATNAALVDAGLPIRLVHLGTIWTVLFQEPGRYNWLLQYYLRAEGLTLSWVGTGRCLVSMDFSDHDYLSLKTKVVDAARGMQRDGWWLTSKEFPGKDRIMKRRLVRDVLVSMVPRPVHAFVTAVQQRKEDDHHASHNDPANQYLHLISSSVFIYCYAIIAMDLTQAMFLGLGSLLVRQFGHAVLEPACHEEEETLLGFNTPNKTLIVIGYLLIPAVMIVRAGAWNWTALVQLADPVALNWFRWTLTVVLGRVAFLTWKHDFRTAMVWFVKLVTDPFTDIVAYFPRRVQRA